MATGEPEPTLGIHAFVFSTGRSEADYEQVASRAANAGFGLVELPLLDAVGISADVVRRVFGRYGIALTCSAGLTADTDLISPDPAARRRGEQLLRRAVRLAAELGSPILSGVLYGALGRAERRPGPEELENAATALRGVARDARAAGVAIGVEPVNRYETSVVNTADEALALVDAIGEPNVVLHLDTFHMNIEETDPAAAVERAGARLGYVHAADSHRGPLGTGTVNFDSLFDALARIGYAGPIVFEAFTASAGAGALAPALALWRDVWTDADRLALDAHAFLRRGREAATRRLAPPPA